jgi:formylglycine-generating enzyme required for sulfatase activity
MVLNRQLRLPIGRDTDIELVWCPDCDFLMGSEHPAGTPLDRPRHRVRLTRGFWIGVTPITQRQWTEITGSPLPLFEDSERGAHLPAEGMDWDTARRFCGELKSRLQQEGSLDPDKTIDLPTEAQWEYACRAGSLSTWHFGENAAELELCAWYAANSGGRPHEVGSKQPNAWGLYDTYGNVAEWCLDDLYKYGDRDEVDPCRFDTTGLVKVVRGGEFSSPAGECRSAARSSCNRDNPFRESTGLRIVCYQGSPPYLG